MSHQLVKVPSQQLFHLQATMATLNSRIAGSMPGSAEWNAPREFRNGKLLITCQNDSNTLALVSYTHRVLNLANGPCWCQFSQQCFGVILAYAKRSLPFKVKFDSTLIKMSAAIAALDYTNWGSVLQYINKLMHFPFSSEQTGVRKIRFKLPAHTHYGDSSLGNGCEAEGRKFLQRSEDMVFHKAARGRYVHKYSAWCGDDNCKFTSRTVETTKSHVVALARRLSIRSAAVNKTACYF